MIRRLTRKDVDGFDRARLLELGLLIFQALPEFYEKVSSTARRFCCC